MMYDEFLEMSKKDITYNQYKEIVEPMYNAVEQMSKKDFITFLMPSLNKLEKKNKAEKRKNQKTVFIGDGSRTPNGCYYLGRYAKLVDWDIDVRSAKTIYEVRKLTEDEEYELCRQTDPWIGLDLDIDMSDPMSKIKWVA